MAKWVTRSISQGGRNGTTSHTFTFTQPSAGQVLLAIVSGSVTSTTPSGWSLLKSSVNNGGLYAFTRTADGSETAFTVSHNGSNYPVVAVVYAFPSGTTVAGSVNGFGSSGTTFNGPGLSGLTGTNLLMSVASLNNQTAGVPTLSGWSSSAVEDTDVGVPAASGTDGYVLGIAYLEDSALTSWTPSATWSTSVAPGPEALTIALKVPASSTNTGTMSAATPRARAALSGAQRNQAALASMTARTTSSIAGAATVAATLTATAILAGAALAGSGVNPGAMGVSTACPTASLAGQSSNLAGLSTATQPPEASMPGALVAPAALAGSTPPLTAAAAAATTGVADLGADLPRPVASINGSSTNAATLAGAAPVAALSIAGATTNTAVLATSTQALRADVGDQAILSGGVVATTPPVTASSTGQSSNPAALTVAVADVKLTAVGDATNSASIDAALRVPSARVTGSSGTQGHPVRRPGLMLTVPQSGLTLTVPDTGLTLTVPDRALELT